MYPDDVGGSVIIVNCQHLIQYRVGPARARGMRITTNAYHGLTNSTCLNTKPLTKCVNITSLSVQHALLVTIHTLCVWSRRGEVPKYENRNIVFQNFKFPTSVDRRMFESLNVRRSYFRTSKSARVAAGRERQYFSASKRARTVSHGFAAQLPPQA